MYEENQNPTLWVYTAPDCCVCETVSATIICASGNIDDWLYDENGI